LANDYSESAAWLSSEGRPEFDERFFEELRDSVFQSVRADQKARSRASGQSGWLLMFATAAATMIFAFSPMLNGSKIEQLPVTQPGGNGDPEPRLAVRLSGTDGSDERHVARRARTLARAVPRTRAVRVLPVINAQPLVASELKHDLAEEVAAATTTLRRIEIQTADPTIRIIWLVNDSTAPFPTPVATDD
jgi:hypothetical protein